MSGTGAPSRFLVRGARRDGLELAADRVFDVAFLDIGLSDMTGHELARRLREVPGTAAGVLAALSGYGQPRDLLRRARLGSTTIRLNSSITTR